MNSVRNRIASALLALVFIPGSAAPATAGDAQIKEQSVAKQFVIIKSTRDYGEALRTARLAATSLGMKLDLRGLTENQQSGLTLDRQTCESDEGGGHWPCYYARGRYDDGTFISIEYSSAFQGFSKGYYIVVVASHPRDDQEITASLDQARTQFPDAYVKTTSVYMGCMH